MAAPSPNQSEFEVPEGWMMVTKPNKKGELVKCYTNILGQRFYSESDLMRYINYAKERGFSIYAPDFVPPTTGPFAMQSKPKMEIASSSNPKHATKSNVRRGGSTSNYKNQKEIDEGHDAQCLVDEVQTEDEIQCARALLEISGQRSAERRTSRRISGRQPELQIDFDFNRPLEYVIKDKRHKSQH
ncbi:hypothetical protein PHJA_000102700 [Phtheirospermum japonicum]|uniref:MBD domain-containing protein n=1 Tax=Phtheirospermum japonicum TaxID=374723 RepID=A0A830B276_9LAMI|nr:hypothetical protein PHJA_000102700 [Phtheirospermum japonicum]